GPADAVATFQDRIGLTWAFVLQMIARGDAGQSGADDQHVEMFLHGALRCADRPAVADRTIVPREHAARKREVKPQSITVRDRRPAPGTSRSAARTPVRETAAPKQARWFWQASPT